MFAPFGVLGGAQGQTAHHVFVLSGNTFVPEHKSKDEGVRMLAGDSLCLETPGGGGYGRPLERSPQLVARDVERDYYGRDTAQNLYGVVLVEDSFEVDFAETRRIRAQLATE